MTRKWQEVRMFISSTCRNMHAERDHLVTVVFPELRERLALLKKGKNVFDSLASPSADRLDIENKKVHPDPYANPHSFAARDSKFAVENEPWREELRFIKYFSIFQYFFLNCII